VSPHIYDVHYADQRTSLVMEADLERGWRKLQKTYGYFQQTKIPYHGDLTIRAQMTVIAQPGSFEEWASAFPDVEIKECDGAVRYSLEGRRLILNIPLSRNQAWRKTRQGRPEIFVEELPLLSLGGNRWFDLRAWVVFHEGSSRPVPDVRVWAENNLVIPGGQFESNRRRH
jgi:hypothetical protein